MRLVEKYSFTNNRQIWRLIPAGDKLIIEEREPHTKEVFFNCVDLKSGRVIFRDFQFDEKFWIGIEVVYNDVIYFHKFGKPDMPGHKEIISVDLYTLEVLWSNPKLTFLAAFEEKVYAFINLFEGREYYILDFKTGEVQETLQDKDININELRVKAYDDSFYHDAMFPNECKRDDPAVTNILKGAENPLAGSTECIHFLGHLLMSYHIEESPGALKNIFSVVEIGSENIIFKDVLNHKTQKIIPDNFFVKGNNIILIKEKSVLQVYSLK